MAHLILSFNPGLQHKEVEKLCHRFAGAMLMPRETFINELGGYRHGISLQELIVIKKTYGMSVQAIMARDEFVGALSQNRWIIVLRNWKTWHYNLIFENKIKNLLNK